MAGESLGSLRYNTGVDLSGLKKDLKTAEQVVKRSATQQSRSLAVRPISERALMGGGGYGGGYGGRGLGAGGFSRDTRGMLKAGGLGWIGRSVGPKTGAALGFAAAMQFGESTGRWGDETLKASREGKTKIGDTTKLAAMGASDAGWAVKGIKKIANFGKGVFGGTASGFAIAGRAMRQGISLNAARNQMLDEAEYGDPAQQAKDRLIARLNRSINISKLNAGSPAGPAPNAERGSAEAYNIMIQGIYEDANLKEVRKQTRMQQWMGDAVISLGGKLDPAEGVA